jgi:hypothetical protein
MAFRWTENELDNSLFAESLKKDPDENTIRNLLKAGANINAIDCKNDTVIGDAISNLNDGLDIKYIKLLIDLGADVNLLTEGVNSLFHAVFLYRVDIFKLLLEAGADPNCIIDDEAISILDMIIDDECFCHMEYEYEEEKIQKEIGDLLIKYGAKQARDLYTSIPEKYILIHHNYPTGMLTYKRNIKAEDVIKDNILLSEFNNWVNNTPVDWNAPKELYLNYYDYGINIAKKIKNQLENIEVKLNYFTCETWEPHQHGKYEWRIV